MLELPSGRVRASWQRSEAYGVPSDEVQPVFTGSEPEGSLFLECGREVLNDLHRALSTEPVSLMLADAEGLVLSRLSGDGSLLRALDRVHLAPGFSYSERDAGTNGLGLALADRQPSLVRAKEHFAESLRGYTCAAAPVLDPLTGRLEGSVNLTTWSDSSNELLLALAQSAASSTAALMLARSRGAHGRPSPRGAVFRIEAPRPDAGPLVELSASWRDALSQASHALSIGRVLVVVGEPGAGRTTLAAEAQRANTPRGRILAAASPEPRDLEAWLDLWTPELAKRDTSAVVCGAGDLPAWAAERLIALLAPGTPLALIVERYEDLPGPLTGLPHAVVEVTSLRERSVDVLPIAYQVARNARGRDVGFTSAAERALSDFDWPGNVAELAAVIREAVTHTDVVDVAHLPARLLSGVRRRLSRIEAFERDEIIRVLTTPGVTMAEAAAQLGMSRATVYRKIAQYDIHVR